MKSDRYLEFVAVEDGAIPFVVDGYGAYKETAIPLPTSQTEMLAFLLHRVDFRLGHPHFIDTLMTSVACYLTKAHQTGPIDLADPDLIAQYFWHVSVNQVAGSGISKWEDGKNIWTFDPPILIARDHVYMGGRTFQETANQVVQVRLGYTLEKVSREAFIAALVS